MQEAKSETNLRAFKLFRVVVYEFHEVQSIFEEPVCDHVDNCRHQQLENGEIKG